MIVDPFCGTGGIAIEASLLGLEVLASDLDSRMVEGTKSTLIGLWGPVHTRSKDALRTPFTKPGEVDGMLFRLRPHMGGMDLGGRIGCVPRCAIIRWQDVQGNHLHYAPISPDALDSPLSEDPGYGHGLGHDKQRIRETGWSVSMASPVRVHKSLSRLVVLCHPAH